MPYLNFYVKQDGVLVFSNDYENLKLQIHSVDGRLIREEIITTVNREYKVLSTDIAKGVYSISVSSQLENASNKIIF